MSDNKRFVENDLNGNWKSEYGETFAIDLSSTPQTLTYELEGFGVIFAGSIEKIKPDSDAAVKYAEGYIYIQYTTNALDPATEGKHYALRWEKLSINSPKPDTSWISGSSDGYGKESLAEAEEEYTKKNGYFEFGSECEKADAEALPTRKLSGHSPFLQAYLKSFGLAELPARK
jgi:hypothetical protein